MSTLGAEACLQPIGRGPGRGRESVERAGELGHRKIPGLRLIGWGFSVQQKQTAGRTDDERDATGTQRHSKEEGGGETATDKNEKKK